MRLRPSGESGPIASSLAGFARYQRESAWTWEHMALTRARPIAGDADLQRRVRDAIATALCRPRDPRRLVADVADMRRRIAEEYAAPLALGSAQPPRRADRPRIHRAIPDAARGAAHGRDILRRDTDAALGCTRRGRDPAAARRARTERGARAAAHLRALLALLFDGTPDAAALAGPAGATLARCAGAVDFAQPRRGYRLPPARASAPGTSG